MIEMRGHARPLGRVAGMDRPALVEYGHSGRFSVLEIEVSSVIDLPGYYFLRVALGCFGRRKDSMFRAIERTCGVLGEDMGSSKGTVFPPEEIIMYTQFFHHVITIS